jgi:hypothetical protein
MSMSGNAQRITLQPRPNCNPWTTVSTVSRVATRAMMTTSRETASDSLRKAIKVVQFRVCPASPHKEDGTSTRQCTCRLQRPYHRRRRPHPCGMQRYLRFYVVEDDSASNWSDLDVQVGRDGAGGHSELGSPDVPWEGKRSECFSSACIKHCLVSTASLLHAFSIFMLSYVSF